MSQDLLNEVPASQTKYLKSLKHYVKSGNSETMLKMETLYI
jgi:hypothetical protein